MKRICLYRIEITSLFLCLLLLQLGCQEQLEVQTKPKQLSNQPETSLTMAAPVLPQTYMPIVAAAYPDSTPGSNVRPASNLKARQTGPKITFEKTTHDYGNIGPMTKNKCRFTFKNTGTNVLKISKVEACCRVVAGLVGGRKQYSPGQGGAVEAELTADTQPGPVFKRIHVVSNDSTAPRLSLTLKAKIVAKIEYEPKTLTLMPGRKDAACPPIKLRSLDGQPFAINDFKSSGDSIKADYNPAFRKTLFVLRPKIDPQKLRHALNGQIRIGLTHPQCNSVNISYSSLPRFKLKPPTLVLFRAQPNKPVRRTVYVLNNYNENFQIESATSGDVIKILSRKKIHNGYRFDLQITPPPPLDEAKFFTDVFTVATTDGGKFSIPCRGFYPPKPSPPSKP